MSKKEFYKDVYYPKYQLVFATIVHRKGGGPEKSEKERIQKIIKEISDFNEKERFIIYKKYLRLFSSPFGDAVYYIIPQKISEKQVQQAIKSFINNKKKSSGSENELEYENNGGTEKEESFITEEVKSDRNENIDGEKKLLSPRVELSVKGDINENELIEFPKIDINKHETKKIKTSFRFKGNLNPQKKVLSVSLTERNRTIVNDLKELYKNQCQICSQSLEIGYRDYYSEVHHIQPLGKHKGPDVTDNMIVVCPNHHTLFDKGAISIDIVKKEVIHFMSSDYLNEKPLILKHRINQKYIDYHSENIFLKKKKSFNSSRKVDYGDTVIFFDGENTEEITLESFINRGLMNNKQRMLLNKLEGETFTFNDFKYEVLKIKG